MKIFVASMVLVAGSVLALDNIPDNEIAACKVKSNDFVFLCHLNTKNYHSCKFMLGTQFDLPTCKPCEEKSVVEKVNTPAPSNPLLDLFGVKK